MAKPTTNRVKTSGTPVIRKDLEGGVVAEANNDGSIYVDKSVKKGSPLEKEAIAHEKVHIDQMERGDLNYDDNNVHWKGKIYPRSSMNEGAKQLPWEKEAYDKTKHMNNNKKSSPNKMTGADLVANNRQVHSKFNNWAAAMQKTETKSPTQMKATPITYKASALKRTVASNEFMESYGDKDKPKKKEQESSTTTDSEKVIKDGKIGTLKTTEKSGTETTTPGSKDLYDGSGGYMGNRKWKKWYNSPAGAEYRSKYTISGDAKPRTVTTPPVIVQTFDPDKIKVPGTPGEKSTYQMGYWEAANLAAARKGMYKNNQKQNRKRQRDAARFDRQNDKGKTMYDAGGNPIPNTPEGKASYLRSQAKTNPNFGKQTQVSSGGTESTLATIEDSTPENTPGSENLRNLDKKTDSKIDAKTGLLTNDAVKSTANLKGSSIGDLELMLKKNKAAKETNTPAGYNTTNKNKSAFKMSGYGSKTLKK